MYLREARCPSGRLGVPREARCTSGRLGVPQGGWVYLGVCTRLSVPRGMRAGCTSGCMRAGCTSGCMREEPWWEESLGTMVGREPGYHGGYTSLCICRVYMVGIPPCVYAGVSLPGCTYHATHPMPVRASAPAHAEVPAACSPGSRRRKPMGESLPSLSES